MLRIESRGTAACDFDRDTLDYSILGLGTNCRGKFVAHLNDPLGRASIHEPDNYQVPLWSVILGIVILEEAPRQNLFLAMTLILIGLCLSQYGALKRLFRPE